MSRAALLALLFAALSAQAQKPSDSYLRLTESDGQGLSGRWDVSLQDLDDVLGLDLGGDGAITWGEVLAREADIRRYVLGRLVLGAEDGPCALVSRGGLRIRRHSDGAYAVLDFDARCTGSPARLDVDYTLLFDRDPLHRGIVLVGAREPLIFSASQHFARVRLRDESAWRTTERMTVEGTLHVLTRVDHLLFLFALLLPSVLRRGADGRWVARSDFGEALWDVVKVVSAFTVAHALTLVAATLGWASLPPGFVSVAIVLGILVAAFDNVRPLGRGTRWTVAFVLGLLHGFGFASVLAGMGLSAGRLTLALLGFNLGVELGQVAFVAALLPLAFLLREAPLYRRLAVTGGSVVIALLACFWLAERALGLGVSVT